MGLQPMLPVARQRVALLVVSTLCWAIVDARITQADPPLTSLRAGNFDALRLNVTKHSPAVHFLGGIDIATPNFNGEQASVDKSSMMQEAELHWPLRQQLLALFTKFAGHLPGNSVFLQKAITAGATANDGDDQDKPTIPKPTVTERIINASCYVLFVGLAAYIYNAHLRLQYDASNHVEASAEDPKGDFHFSLFATNGCFDQDRKICCMAFACVSILWADTMSQDKLRESHVTTLTFWFALLFPTVAIVASILVPGAALGSLLFLGVAVYFRQRIRKAYGLNTGVGPCAMDVLTWCFCTPCAAVQEARQVKYLAPTHNVLAEAEA